MSCYREKFLLIGMSDYMSKFVDQFEFVPKILHHLGRHSSGASLVLTGSRQRPGRAEPCARAAPLHVSLRGRNYPRLKRRNGPRLRENSKTASGGEMDFHQSRFRAPAYAQVGLECATRGTELRTLFRCRSFHTASSNSRRPFVARARTFA